MSLDKLRLAVRATRAFVTWAKTRDGDASNEWLDRINQASYLVQSCTDDVDRDAWWLWLAGLTYRILNEQIFENNRRLIRRYARDNVELRRTDSITIAARACLVCS